jgi:hypothetical protein
MYTITIEHPNFNSNIYVHRQNLSTWLTKYVDIRLNVGTYVMTPDNIAEIDKYLIKYHYAYVSVKTTIDLLEKDTYVFE